MAGLDWRYEAFGREKETRNRDHTHLHVIANPTLKAWDGAWF